MLYNRRSVVALFVRSWVTDPSISVSEPSLMLLASSTFSTKPNMAWSPASTSNKHFGSWFRFRVDVSLDLVCRMILSPFGPATRRVLRRLKPGVSAPDVDVDFK